MEGIIVFPTETPLGIILVGFLYCSLLEICVACYWKRTKIGAFCFFML